MPRRPPPRTRQTAPARLPRPIEPPERCAVCGRSPAPFGYGYRGTRWACMAHRAQVDADAVRLGHVKGVVGSN
jgi:hypothetical protein